MYATSLRNSTVSLQDADKKGLSKIAEEIKHLAQKAKDNSLKSEDYEVTALPSNWPSMDG